MAKSINIKPQSRKPLLSKNPNHASTKPAVPVQKRAPLPQQKNNGPADFSLLTNAKAVTHAAINRLQAAIHHVGRAKDGTSRGPRPK